MDLARRMLIDAYCFLSRKICNAYVRLGSSHIAGNKRWRPIPVLTVKKSLTHLQPPIGFSDAVAKSVASFARIVWLMGRARSVEVTQSLAPSAS